VGVEPRTSSAGGNGSTASRPDGGYAPYERPERARRAEIDEAG